MKCVVFAGATTWADQRAPTQSEDSSALPCREKLNLPEPTAQRFCSTLQWVPGPGPPGQRSADAKRQTQNEENNTLQTHLPLVDGALRCFHEVVQAVGDDFFVRLAYGFVIRTLQR